MNLTVQSKLESLRLGAPQVFKNLAIIPLFDEAPSRLDYLSLKSALEKSLAFVTEVSEGGSVPELKVTNKADKPILLIDGEELVGAKQNRIVNTSILLAAESETLIPVSCTESGRWHYNSRAFQSSDNMMYASARASKSARVAFNKMSSDRYDAEQGRIWEDVASLHTKNRTFSDSAAMSDSYSQRHDDLSEYLQAFPLLDNQKGIIALVNGKPWAADYVSNASSYADLHDKLVKSFAADCLSLPIKEIESNENLAIDAWKILRDLSKSTESVVQPIGLGSDIRYDAPQLGAAALVYEEILVHMTIFSKQNPADETQGFETRSEFNVGDNLRRPRHF
jgi:hypothetical protein